MVRKSQVVYFSRTFFLLFYNYCTFCTETGTLTGNAFLNEFACQ